MRSQCARLAKHKHHPRTKILWARDQPCTQNTPNRSDIHKKLSIFESWKLKKGSGYLNRGTTGSVRGRGASRISDYIPIALLYQKHLVQPSDGIYSDSLIRVIAKSVRDVLGSANDDVSFRGGNHKQKCCNKSGVENNIEKHANIVQTIVQRPNSVRFVKEASGKFDEYTEILVGRLCKVEEYAVERVLHVTSTLLSLCITWNSYFGGEVGSTMDALIFFKDWCRQCVARPQIRARKMPPMVMNNGSSNTPQFLANMRGAMGDMTSYYMNRFNSEFDTRVHGVYNVLKFNVATLTMARTLLKVVAQHVGGAIAARESVVGSSANTGALLCSVQPGLVAFGTTFVPTLEDNHMISQVYDFIDRNNSHGCFNTALDELRTTSRLAVHHGLATDGAVALSGVHVIDAMVALSDNSTGVREIAASLIDRVGVGVSPSSKKERRYRSNHCRTQMNVLASFEPRARWSDISIDNIDQVAARGAQYWVDAIQDSDMHTTEISNAHAEHFVLEALLTMGMNMEVADSVGAFPVPLPGSSYATRVVSGWANSD